jgi:hypothetical protein
MKFKKELVELVKEVGTFSLDKFICELDQFCDESIPISRSPVKIDVSLLRFIANVVENSFVKKDGIDAKVSKKKIVCDEYIRMKERMGVVLSADDKVAIENLIEDLHSTKQIKKVSNFKYFLKKVKNILLK